MSEPFDLMEQQNRPVPRGKPPDRLFEVDPLHHLWSGQLRLALRRVLLPGTTRLPQALPGPAQADAEEPGAKAGVPAKAGNPLDRPDPGVLHHILRFAHTAAEQAQHELVEGRGMAPVEGPEGRLAPLPEHAARQLGVAFGIGWLRSHPSLCDPGGPERWSAVDEPAARSYFFPRRRTPARRDNP